MVNVLVTTVLWPIPLYRDRIFTPDFFKGWVGVAIFWQPMAIFAVVVYPVYDGRHTITKAVRGVIKDRKVRVLFQVLSYSIDSAKSRVYSVCLASVVLCGWSCLLCTVNGTVAKYQCLSHSPELP